MQVGSIGLINAIDRFDLERGFDLPAFAVPHITGEIKRHLRDRGEGMRLPRGLAELRGQARRGRATSSRAGWAGSRGPRSWRPSWAWMRRPWPAR